MCFKVCFVRFIQSSITLTSLDPTHKRGPNLDGKLAHLEAGLWKFEADGTRRRWSGLVVCQRKRFCFVEKLKSVKEKD